MGAVEGRRLQLVPLLLLLLILLLLWLPFSVGVASPYNSIMREKDYAVFSCYFGDISTAMVARVERGHYRSEIRR